MAYRHMTLFDDLRSLSTSQLTGIVQREKIVLLIAPIIFRFREMALHSAVEKKYPTRST